MAGISQISHDGIGNVFWSNNDLYVEASASQASGAAPITIADLLAGANPNDTPALSGAKLLTIGVYNNATAQTITGLELEAQGTTTTGGTFSIPYPITTDVNGNAVNIASGGSQTFLVPIANGVLRMWVLTPTFGTAPAAGSVDTLTTVQGAAGNGTVLKGSLVPQSYTGPTLIATVTASQITIASANNYFAVPGVLHRAATRRMLAVIPTTNQSVTLKYGIYDSTVQTTSGGDSSIDLAAITSPISTTEGVPYYSGSMVNSALAEAGDSLFIIVGAGATLPTTGELQFYATEVGAVS